MDRRSLPLSRSSGLVPASPGRYDLMRRRWVAMVVSTAWLVTLVKVLVSRDATPRVKPAAAMVFLIAVKAVPTAVM